jgi:predicted nucleic acid-binding protein
VTVVYDAGVLVAADRNERRIWADHRARLERGGLPVTTSPVIAQVSRAPEQVPLRRLLRGCEIVGFDADWGHGVGELLSRTGGSDVVDAHLVLVAARRGSAVIVTSDPDDLRRLSAVLPTPVAVRGV